MLADASGATAGPEDLSTRIHKGFTRREETLTLRAGFPGGGEVSRLYALVLFVLGESVLASLSFGVAAVPALLTFLAGSALLVRGS
jgi:hypothetical protein